MQVESASIILRVLIGLPVLVAAVYLSEYFRKPEDFFIKRLRSREGTEYTHPQLVSRALASALIPGPIMMLWVAIMDFDDGFLEWSSFHTILIIVIILFLGISSYLYFRLWRYRELALNEPSGSRRIFVRREAPNEETWLLRGGLTALFIFMGLTGIPLMILLFMATEWL